MKTEPSFPAPNLTKCERIVLIRCPNGWVAHDGSRSLVNDPPLYAFESTESLARQLEKLIGRSGWEARVDPMVEQFMRGAEK